MTTQPMAPIPQFENFPTELKALPQWVCWKYFWNKDDWTKVPYNAKTGRHADTTDAATWSSLQQARDSYGRGGYDGIGFVFSDDDPYTGIDLDDCINEAGEYTPEAQTILSRFLSYAELSPSQKGIKLWISGDVFPGLGFKSKDIPKRGSKIGKYEAYSALRFFTMTGNVISSSTEITEAQESLDWYIRTYLLPKKKKATKPSNTPPSSNSLDDWTIWQAIGRSSKSDAINNLMKGDISLNGDDDSAADLALLSHLAFWFGPDPNRIEAAFNLSTFAQRDKWKDRQDYRERTIAKALEGKVDFYCNKRDKSQTGPSPAEKSNAPIVPHSNNAERAILGCILWNPPILDEVRTKLYSEDFYVQANHLLYETVCELADHSGLASIDLVTLDNFIQIKGYREQIGGIAAMNDIMQETPKSANAEQYAHIIRRLEERRAIIAAAKWSELEAYKPHDPDSLLEDVEKRFLSIADRRKTSSIITLGKATHLVLDKVEAVAEGKRIGLGTYIPDLDNLVSMKEQDLIICAARTSVGKSIVGGQVALGNALQGKVVFIASVEMAREDIAGRLMSLHGSIDSTVTGARRKATPEEAERLAEVSNELYHFKVFIDDNSAQTTSIIAANARRISRQHGLDLLIVDYLQLVQCVRQRGQTRAEVLGDISRALKRLAKELNIPVLALAQLNRESEHKSEPELHHIRESGDIEQDADQVWLLWRSPENDDLVHLKVAKHRGGPCGNITLWHDKQYMRFLAHNPAYFGSNRQGGRQ